MLERLGIYIVLCWRKNIDPQDYRLQQEQKSHPRTSIYLERNGEGMAIPKEK